MFCRRVILNVFSGVWVGKSRGSSSQSTNFILTRLVRLVQVGLTYQPVPTEGVGLVRFQAREYKACTYGTNRTNLVITTPLYI